MSEIEKMFKNAGVKAKCSVAACSNIDKKCKGCPEWVSPEFTAEKQLELIKWLIIRHSLEINKGRYTTYFMCNRKKYTSSSDDDFTMCLINLMNKIWQDLTESEKEEIKEILK